MVRIARVVETLKGRPKKQKVLVGTLCGLLLITAWYFLTNGAQENAETTTLPPVVTVATISSLQNVSGAQFLGTVRSVSEADLQTDRGGQVTSVRVKAGDFVQAGTVIATFENAAEQASVLQARGVYEAAQAASAQSTVGVAEATTALSTAEKNALTTVASVYNSTAGLVKTTIDAYFANPKSPLPGLRINGYGETQNINAARVSIEKMLQRWQQEVSSQQTTTSVAMALAAADQNTQTVLLLVEQLLTALSKANESGAAEEAERKARIESLTSARTTLLGLQSSVQSATTNIDNAREALKRATINSNTTNGPSASNAQLTQALGALRAAQANLEKTIVRSPITGTVAVLRVKTGEYIAPATPVARIVGGQGQEVSVFIGDRDRTQFVVGAPVTIANTATGSVVNIAPAIDPLTQKIEVKIAVLEPTLVNGDTVTVTLAGSASTTTPNTRLEIPITAVKFTDTAGSIFTVENNKLKSVPVELGAINGELVVVTKGISAATEFVVDARGKTEGEEVVVNRN
jgi:multidrug efflux pump subunit AcrA (membrane-fusion protein)